MKENTLGQFMKSTQSLPFPERYLRWQKQVQRQSHSHELHAYLQRFNQYFPFNTQYWTKLAYLELQKGKPECIKIFQLALAKNPKSISLWRQYFTWLKQTIKETDPSFLLADLERGLDQFIGKHSKSKFVYDYWFEVEKTDITKIFMMRKKMSRALLQECQQARDQSLEWIYNLKDQDLNALAKSQNILQLSSEKIKQRLVTIIKGISQQSIRQFQKYFAFQSKIEIQEYKPYNGNGSLWRSYIDAMKKFRPQDLDFIYQRALITQCDNASLWRQYFSYQQLERGNTHHILELIRAIPYFFKNFETSLFYYWIELEETENPHRARELFVELQNAKPVLQTFVRHVGMQIRAKEFNNAKIIYDSMLTVFANNLQIISYVVIEYAQFAFKYFRDMESSKKLLKVYFEKYPFNYYLFEGYINFYINHIEAKPGNRDILNEFIEMVKNGLKRACSAMTEEQYKKISSKVLFLMRSYVNNIFTIKTAQKGIRQMQLLLKNSDLQEIKRTNEYRYQEIETLTKKRKMNQAKEPIEQNLY